MHNISIGILTENLYEDLYDDLMIFKIDNHKFLTELVERVYKHNLLAQQNEKQPILMFFEKTLKLMAAASQIQCAYRQYRWKRSQESTPLHKIMRRRGAVCMQRGWRKWVIRHRLKALIKIKDICLQITDPEFFIETNVYLNLREIIDKDPRRWRFEEQFLNFEVGEDNLISGQIYLSKTDRYERGSIVPRWFGFDIPVNMQGSFIGYDPYEIIHKHATSPENPR